MITAPAASAVDVAGLPEGDADRGGGQRRGVVDAVAHEHGWRPCVVSSRTSANFCSGLWLA